MPETIEKRNLPQNCSFFTESLGCPLPRQWYSGNLFFFFFKHSITHLATIHSLFFHTHTSTNISFLKCETGLPGWCLHILRNCWWSHCWHWERHCKILRLFGEEKSVIQLCAQNIAMASNWEGRLNLPVSSSKSVAY